MRRNLVAGYGSFVARSISGRRDLELVRTDRDNGRNNLRPNRSRHFTKIFNTTNRPSDAWNRVVRDRRKSQQATGSRGEIVVKGPNVSPGYLARPDLTATHFFEESGQRAYRTGDWGRFRDGLLFFEGRNDNQIKLNGYRIELGDVEADLRALPVVRDAVVLPILKNGKAAVARGFYFFYPPSANLESADPALTTTIRKRLRERLPAYMLPRKFVIVDAFPITANGKVDRQRLAESL